jgi:hypothetical protein
MNTERKKRLFAIFILVIFLGSTFAIAFISKESLPQSSSNATALPTLVDKPLADSEEAPYLQRGLIIVRYFYSADCGDCPKVEDAINGLRDDPGKVLLERIDIDQWPDAATTVGVTTAPAVYLKGMSTKLLNGAVTYSDLFNAACPLYSSPPPSCGY